MPQSLTGKSTEKPNVYPPFCPLPHTNRLLKNSANFVLGSTKSSTGIQPPHHSGTSTDLVVLIRRTALPREYASSFDSPAALLDKIFEHPRIKKRFPTHFSGFSSYWHLHAAASQRLTDLHSSGDKARERPQWLPPKVAGPLLVFSQDRFRASR